ncbi:MAG: cobalamin B12-binding domain-containing protein [Candidatus Eisenbacteria bacterium]|nr:cobalamin B12-binding domain-containing protein [Candidatus Eisenbacteria bacterium]
MPPPPCTELAQAVVEGNVAAARRLAREWGEAGGEPLRAIEEGFAPGIRRVGELWEEGEYFLPELIQGAEAMKAAMEALGPWMAAAHVGQPRKGCVVIGTIQGDLHDIGKSLVATMLTAHGFEVHDLGSDVPVAAFVDAARTRRADIVAVSALLTTTMGLQREVADAVRAAGLGWPVRILVGGAPTGPAWAAEIGAHHAENALRAVAMAESLVS